MPNYNVQIQSNNADLRQILQTLTNKVAGGSGGAQLCFTVLLNNAYLTFSDACMISISGDSDLFTLTYHGDAELSGFDVTGMIEGNDYDIVDTDDSTYITLQIHNVEKQFAINLIK